MVVGTVLVTVGLLLILSDLGALVAGPTSKNIRLELQIFQIMGIIVSTTELYILLGIVALTLALHLILTRTWFGRAVRAVTQDPVGARLCGVRAGADPRRDGRLRLRHRRGRRRALHLELPDQPV